MEKDILNNTHPRTEGNYVFLFILVRNDVQELMTIKWRSCFTFELYIHTHTYIYIIIRNGRSILDRYPIEPDGPAGRVFLGSS